MRSAIQTQKTPNSHWHPNWDRLRKEKQFAKAHAFKFAQLTKREIEILGLVAQGISNPQIAQQLFISRNTVEQHRKNINRKLETNNMYTLIRYAQAFRLV